MSNLLGSIFDFRSKEEKQRIYEEYSKRIFPYGDDQREKILEILAALFPKERSSYVMMHYILIKEGMTAEDPLDFYTAAKKVKHSPIRSTPELEAGIHALLNVDFAIDENLKYPSLEELQAAASSILKKS